MSRVIKMSTPKAKPAGLRRTAALTKAQAEHTAWLEAHGIKPTKNTLRT
jgi:ABC-type molybdate transport system substrate-binding protein